ncbi:MAG: PxxKW family cysteine-rich protein [Desulfobulbaceae bacterium]|nr:PxxKW family cysteine-rich protein [Desulfobulbaceae bacterium]MCK5404960.1 PxxKW family cysteine-rich protein [Desulfobulbaceae bacterium]
MATKTPKQAKDTAASEIYSSGLFRAVVEKCTGCERILEADSTSYCKSYANPEAKWKQGICNFATHVKPEFSATTVKINPLKASKRAMAKK